MATWNKLIVSGSTAELAGLSVDTKITGAIQSADSASYIAGGGVDGKVGSAGSADTSAALTGLQAEAITTNTAKVGITSAQASAITTNSGKISYTDGTKVSNLVAATASYALSANLGTAAGQASTAFATAAQGATADLAFPAADFSTIGKSIAVSETAADARDHLGLGSAALSDAGDFKLASVTTISAGQASAIVTNSAKVGITSGQADAIVANTAKVGITSTQADAITANSAKVGITSGQADAIVANTAKVGITSAQASAITANSSKISYTDASVVSNLVAATASYALSSGLGTAAKENVGAFATSAQGGTADSALQPGESFDDAGFTYVNAAALESDIEANNAKVGYTDAAVKAKLSTEAVVSGSAAEVKSFISIAAADISDVDAFSQSGTYASLRAQATTKADVGLSNVTNESKATMFAAPSFTGNAAAVNLTLSGNLTVNGTTTTVSTSNIEVEDRFAFFNAGGGASSTEGGIIVEGAVAGAGEAFYYDGNASKRWAFASGVAKDATAVNPAAFIAAVFEGSELEMTTAGYSNVGNIRIENGEVFIVTVA